MRPEFTLHDLLHNAAARDPEKPAVVDGDSEYSYRDLERESSALGAALADSGVGRGDRVGVLVEKSWEAIVAMVAASRIGAAYVNVNPLFKAPQVEYLAGDCDIRVMIGDSQKLAELGPNDYVALASRDAFRHTGRTRGIQYGPEVRLGDLAVLFEAVSLQGLGDVHVGAGGLPFRLRAPVEGGLDRLRPQLF